MVWGVSMSSTYWEGEGEGRVGLGQGLMQERTA